MADTSSIKFTIPFVNPATGVLHKWAYNFLLNPSVANLNVAANGAVNAPGATVTFKAVSLGLPLRPTSGGLGITSGNSGGIPAFTAASTITSSPVLQANHIVFGGGVGATPSAPLGLGTTVTVLHGNAAGTPTWAAVNLGADVGTSILPVANGGSGASTAATARTNFGLGTMSTENANAVAITGGMIDGAAIGGSTPAAVAATNLSATGVVTFGGASTLGTFGAAAIAQPTNAGAASAFVQNAGNAVNDASTFDGYTLKQVVKALRNLGLLA